MTETEFENKIIKYHNELNSFLGYNFEQEQKNYEKKGSVSIRNDYYLKKSLIELNNFINVYKYEQALESFESNLHHFIDIGSVTSKTDVVEKRHLKLAEYYEIVYNIIKLNEKYKSFNLSTYLDKFKTLPFFDDDELNGLDHKIQVYIERAINEKLFKNYLYSGESDYLTYDNILFYPNIGISEDIDSWLSFLNKQNDFNINNPNTIVATLFLQLDDIEPHFSSFLITLHKGNNIWVCTDKLSFGNPYNKQAQSERGNLSGKISRSKEEHYENIGLPYRLAWNMDDIRMNSLVKSSYYENIDLSNDVKLITKDQYTYSKNINDNFEKFNDIAEKELIKLGYKYNSSKILDVDYFSKEIKGIVYKYNGRKVAYFQPEYNGLLIIYNKPEINIFNLNKLDAIEKFYYVNLVERLIEEIQNNPDLERVELISDYLNHKMLGDEIFYANDDGFSHYSSDVKEEINDLFVGSDIKEMSLVPLKYNIVLSTAGYNNNMLDTPDKLENNIRWNVLDEKRKVIQDKLNKLKINKNKDIESLKILLETNKDNFNHIIFSADEVLMRIKQSSFTNKGYNHYYLSSVINDKSYKREFLGFTVGKSEYEKEICLICDKYYSLSQIKITIKHYKDLMLLTGLSRNELPPYYRNYKSHDNIIYKGNSNLNNTHPYTRLYDPCSNDHPNGLYITVYMCNKCFRKLSKQYKRFEKPVIIDGVLEEYKKGENNNIKLN